MIMESKIKKNTYHECIKKLSSGIYGSFGVEISGILNAMPEIAQRSEHLNFIIEPDLFNEHYENFSFSIKTMLPLLEPMLAIGDFFDCNKSYSIEIDYDAKTKRSFRVAFCINRNLITSYHLSERDNAISVITSLFKLMYLFYDKQSILIKKRNGSIKYRIEGISTKILNLHHEMFLANEAGDNRHVDYLKMKIKQLNEYLKFLKNERGKKKDA